jgi:probable addiction module antidote protein
MSNSSQHPPRAGRVRSTTPLPAPLRAPLTLSNRGEALEALGEMARAKGLVAFAEDVGLTRLTLYKALRLDGNPQFTTVLAVLEGLGLELQVVPASRSNARPSTK